MYSIYFIALLILPRSIINPQNLVLFMSQKRSRAGKSSPYKRSSDDHLARCLVRS